jgi:hypothetical protein
MKLLILSNARSGSGYLRDLLYTYSSKDTILIDEPFQIEQLPNNNAQQRYVTKIIKSCLKNNNIVFKTHLTQLYRLDNQIHINFFLEDKIWYRILLLRKDLFKCSFSHAVADALNNFGDNDYTNLSFAIKEDVFLNILETKIFYWNEFLKIKLKNNYNKIVYFEDLTFNIKTDYKKVDIKLKDTNQREYITLKKTPYSILNIENEQKLKELFNNRMLNFSYSGIKNNNGFLELE